MSQPSMTIEIEGVAPEPAKAAAFRRLADLHLSDAYRLARLILRDSTEAEDAVHDAFVTAWMKWSTLRDPDLFTPWFDRIVVNTCRNRLRSRWRRQGHAEVTEVSRVFDDPHAVTLDRDLVGSAFGHLDPDDRVVLALRYYRDLQVDEISRLLDVRPGTVKSRIHRALGRLRSVMAIHGVAGVDG
jgi:RNA polymerase sigma-70 factor (ECF subfamily)